MVKGILCTLVILFFMSSCVNYTQNTLSVPDVQNVQKYLFSGQDTEYFSNELGSCLMELRPDGRYQEQSYNNIDKGTWEQLKDGRIRLISDARYNNLYTDEFSLDISCKEILEQLPSMGKRLSRLLDENNQEWFSIHIIEDSSKCICDGNEILTVRSFTHQQEFSRTDVADLIKAIYAYLKDDDKNASYLHAYQYPLNGIPKVIFLYDDTNDLEDLDDVIRQIDTGRAPHLTLRLVDKSDYDESIRKEQGKKLAFDKMHREYQDSLAKNPPIPPAEANIYFFPKGQPQYFALSMSHTQYLILKPNGRYRETESSHFGVDEFDKGSWKQLPDGRIRMVSRKKFHMIESGSLSIYIADKEEIRCLKVLKKEITSFLNSNDKQTFSGAEIRGIMKNQTGLCGFLQVDLDYQAKTTSRNNMQKLIGKIDLFLQDPEKNVFYYLPYVYRDVKFLIESDDIKDMEYLEYMKKSIDNKEMLFVFTGIDAVKFEKGSKKPQPFRYYPEMNEMLESLQEEE